MICAATAAMQAVAGVTAATCYCGCCLSDCRISEEPCSSATLQGFGRSVVYRAVVCVSVKSSCAMQYCSAVRPPVCLSVPLSD